VSVLSPQPGTRKASMCAGLKDTARDEITSWFLPSSSLSFRLCPFLTEVTRISFFASSTWAFSVTSWPSWPFRASGLLTVQVLLSLSLTNVLPSVLILPDRLTALVAAFSAFAGSCFIAPGCVVSWATAITDRNNPSMKTTNISFFILASFRFSMLASGVLSSEKRLSDARCRTCLLLDKKSLLSSEMSVKPLTVFQASIRTYEVLARGIACAARLFVPGIGRQPARADLRNTPDVAARRSRLEVGVRSAHRRSHCPSSSTKLHLAVLVDRKATQECEVVQELRCAEHDAAEGIVGDAYRQTGFIPYIFLSKFRKSAPPPARTMPRSLMSAESSGGVRSRSARIALTIVDTHSFRLRGFRCHPP